MRRFLFALGGVALVAAALAGIMPAANATTGCVTAAAATYQHKFDGPGGNVTITAVQPLCEGEEQAFSLVSYTTRAAKFAVPQFVYDTDSAWIGADRRSVTLDVAVPGCYTQVDAIFGTGIVNEITSSYVYNDSKLGSPDGIGSRSTGGRGWYNGGSAACTPKPSVTFRSYCDGVLHTRLANAADAGVNASFVVGGKRIVVRPGKHADLTSRPSGAVSVRDNSFKTTTGSWSQPADCAPVVPPSTPASVPSSSTPTSTPGSSTPASTPSASTPGSSTPGSAPPSASVPGSAPSSAAPGTSVPASAAPTSSTPATVPSPVVSSPTPDDGLPITGSNTSGLALYALGFLLIGGGLVVVARQARRGRHSA
ncbi:hypothetical protein OHA21_36710 [Actinoplanes sp. NBC_00393]|uniref:hypothetical protein n=1 Tax=Actinoplanes sp. NBC_00393 TaxID=2975953 RepID=UPI002E20E0C0